MNTRSSRLAINEAIELRLDRLEAILKEGAHINDAGVGFEEANKIIESLSTYWSVMNDEQKDFVHGAQHMLENRSRWED